MFEKEIKKERKIIYNIKKNTNESKKAKGSQETSILKGIVRLLLLNGLILLNS